MVKGQHLKPEQIFTLLCQIYVLTANGKTLAQACKEVCTVEQSFYCLRKIYGGMQVDQARKYKDLDLKNIQIIVGEWVKHYNHEQPHSALGYRPPAPQVQITKIIQNQLALLQ